VHDTIGCVRGVCDFRVGRKVDAVVMHLRIMSTDVLGAVRVVILLVIGLLINKVGGRSRVFGREK